MSTFLLVDQDIKFNTKLNGTYLPFGKKGGCMAREEVWGRGGNTRWLSMLDSKVDGLRNVNGPAAISMGSITVDRQSTVIFGESNWKSYELRFGLQIMEGANAQIQLRRSDDGKQCYMVDFLFGWQALGVSRINHRPGGKGLQKLSVVNLEMSRLAEFKVEIAVRELSITTYVDGKLINQVTDDAFDAGPMAFCAWEAKARFDQPEYRVLG